METKPLEKLQQLQKPTQLSGTEVKSTGNQTLDNWLKNNIGKSFTEIKDQKQKEAMMDYLEKNDPVISQIGGKVVRPLLMGPISADTKLGKLGQRISQGVQGFRQGYSGQQTA
jgi:hypothetical protein